jgi:hypothetical protein
MTHWSKIFANKLSIVCSKRENVADEKFTKRLLSARSNERWKCASNYSKRRKKWRFNEQSFHQVFFDRMKTHVMRVSTRNQCKICETLMKHITFKKMKLHKNLTKLKKFFVTHMKTRRIELIDYFFFRRVFTVLSSSCICEHSRQTLRHVFLFCANWFEECQRMLREKETTNMKRFFNSKKELRIAVN